mgnify:CR=1 FL=1
MLKSLCQVIIIAAFFNMWAAEVPSPSLCCGYTYAVQKDETSQPKMRNIAPKIVPCFSFSSLAHFQVNPSIGKADSTIKLEVIIIVELFA